MGQCRIPEIVMGGGEDIERGGGGGTVRLR